MALFPSVSTIGWHRLPRPFPASSAPGWHAPRIGQRIKAWDRPANVHRHTTKWMVAKWVENPAWLSRKQTGCSSVCSRGQPACGPGWLLQPPCVTFRRVAVSVRGLDSPSFFPPRAASGQCFLTAAAAGVACGVVSAVAEPSSWCALPKSPLCMGMGTLCTAKKPPMLVVVGTLCTAKKPPMLVVVGTFCTAKKPAMYGHGDTLHCQKASYVWAWGHVALPKSPLCMGMGTLCTAKKPTMYVYGDTLHCQKARYAGCCGDCFTVLATRLCFQQKRV